MFLLWEEQDTYIKVYSFEELIFWITQKRQGKYIVTSFLLLLSWTLVYLLRGILIAYFEYKGMPQFHKWLAEYP